MAQQLIPFIGRPLYGAFGVHHMSARAYYATATKRCPVAIRGEAVSSLLPDSFNALMCQALNYADMDGVRPTHFVMLHGDIAPQEWWVDILLEEIERTKAGILSAVVPIKSLEIDDTSTAIGVLNGRHSSYRRMTTAECMDLPETFTGEDVCTGEEKLLLNTGCMAIDLRQDWVRPWMETGGFRLESHCWKNAEGHWQRVTLPEDWLMSWDAQTKFGVKCAATTKIRVIHYGDTGFANRYPRIKPEDSSPLGWLSEVEAKALARWASGKLVLEVGAYKGLSTCIMAKEALHVTTIDTFDGRGTPNPCDTWPEFQENVKSFGLEQRVSPKIGESAEVLTQLRLRDAEYDFAFIDGTHDYESVKADVEGVEPLVRPHGYIALHDHSEDYPGVMQAVAELRDRGWKSLEQIGSLVVLRRQPALALVEA